MSPAYHNLQLVLLDKQDKAYQIGDVVAFPCEGLSSILAKLVAAAEGDSVVIEDATLYVNGQISPLYGKGRFKYAGILIKEQQLEKGEFVVLGDNIELSMDSRYEEVGIISADVIIGKVIR